jgi:flavin-dependent dehydrogenase
VVRAAHGPGWALAGDAGLAISPITGYGIGHALRDAELLSGAIIGGIGGATKLSRALSRYEKHRNRETYPALDWTLGLTRLGGVNENGGAALHRHWHRQARGIRIPRHDHRRGSDGILLQLIAFDPTHRSQGFSAACACSLAVNVGMPTG